MTIYFYVFFVGLYSIFPRYIEFFNINISNAIAAVAFAMTFLFNTRIYITRAKKIIFALFPFWLNLIYRIIAFALSGIHIEAIMYMITTILLCISICMVVTSYKRFQLLIEAILNAAIIVCIYGIIECITQTNILFAFREDYFVEIRNGIYRISTSFDHPIVYANYLGIILMLVAYKICNYSTKSKQRKYIVLYVLVVINLLITVSRSAIIVVALFQIILFYILEQRKKSTAKIFKFFIFPAMGITTFLVLLTGDGSTQSNSIFQVFVDFLKGGLASVGAVGDRFALYFWVWEATKNSSLFGNGITAVFAYQRSYNYIKNSIEVEYLYTFFKLGFVGLFILIASYFSVLAFVRKNRNSSLKRKNDFNFFVFLMLSAYYVILLAVTQQTEMRTYLIVVSQSICYSQIIGSNKNYDSWINGV